MNPINYIQNYLHSRKHRRLVSALGIDARAKILDISCGEGDVLSILKEYGCGCVFHGIDISQKAIQQAEQEYPWGVFSVADAETIPYPSTQFSTVLSCMSLHHYKNPQSVFTEIARVLTPDGQVCIADLMPQWKWSQWLHNKDGCNEPYHFERYYRAAEIESMAKTAGLIRTQHSTLNHTLGIQLICFKKLVPMDVPFTSA